MLLFRLADLPRRVRRLPTALPLDPSAAGMEEGAGAAVVEWSLTPELLDPDSRRLRTRLKRLFAVYAEAEGQPRAVLEASSERLEEMMGDYRLARCLARTVEHLGYEFVAPPPPLPHEPVALRALCYRRAGERYSGYVPRARRADFLAAIAAELESTPELLEAALWADRAGAALLRRRITDHDGGRAAALQSASVIAAYNAAAVATVVASSSLVALYLDAAETAALKDLYRYARALHVGVEIARGATDDVLEIRLYGPGSRALVRSRTAIATPDLSSAPIDDEGGVRAVVGADSAPENAGEAGETGQVGQVAEDDESDMDLLTATEDGESGVAPVPQAAELRLPAAGGAPVAAVVLRLAQHHAGALRGGWMRLLGYERRLFHVPLEGELLDALRGDAAVESSGAGQELYDSAVEEQFARAFHAHESAGRGGLVRGWRLRREPRTVVVDTTVFLPDFSFRRGEVEVYGEVIGFYTEEYLTRKTRKLAALRGQLPLLLIVDRDLAPLFAATGFPVVTYKAGRQIGVSEVVVALEQHFDPFARRRDRARAALARLCATSGPNMPEEELSVAIGCAGRSELLTLWSEVVSGVEDVGIREAAEMDATEPLRRVAEARETYDASQASDRLPRHYLPGYGLIQGGAVAAARAALHDLLRETGGPVPLETALARVAQAGIPGPDEALLERLGALVARAGLFGAAQVYLPGMAIEELQTAESAAAPARPRRHQRKAASTPDGASQGSLPAVATPNQE